MAQLKELYEELNFPSKTKLLQAAKKRGIPIAGMDVLYKEQPVGQLFGKAPVQRGAIATAGEHDKWQADLISFKQFSRKQNSGYTDALSVTNVFDRKTHVLPVKSKEQKVVWEAFEQILTKFGGKPRRLDVDAGTEFTGVFAEQARAKGIEIHTRSANPPDKDFLAVGDAAMGSLKRNLGRDMAAKNSDVWVDKLAKAEKAYNNTGNSTALYDAAPNEVKDDKVLQFRLRQDNGRKLAKNGQQLKQRQDKLEEQGYFRAQLPKQTFGRSFKPKFSSQVYKADEIRNNKVVSAGRTFELSKVMPVASGSAQVNVPASLVKGSQAMEASKKEKLQPFVARLKAFVQGGPKTLKQVGEHMKAQAAFNTALSAARLNKPGGVKQFAQLFSDFKVTGGVGQSTVALA